MIDQKHMETKVTQEDIRRFKERVDEMKKTGEKNFFRTYGGIINATDGIRELISKFKQKVGDLYWEDIKSKLIN